MTEQKVQGDTMQRTGEKLNALHQKKLSKIWQVGSIAKVKE